MTMSFRGTDFQYFRQRKHKWALLFALTFFSAVFSINSSYAVPFQDTAGIKVNGKVTDLEEGAPLAGVSVQNMRTRSGTVTNAAGNYSIEASIGDSIRFSFTGKLPKTVLYSGQASINIELTKYQFEYQ